MAAEVTAAAVRSCSSRSSSSLPPTMRSSEHDPAAALGFLQRLPEALSPLGLAAAGRFAGELEVFQEGDEVVLSARGAGQSPGSGHSCPRPRPLRSRLRRPARASAPVRSRERYDRAADTAHETVHDRPQQRAALAAALQRPA